MKKMCLLLLHVCALAACGSEPNGNSQESTETTSSALLATGEALRAFGGDINFPDSCTMHAWRTNMALTRVNCDTTTDVEFTDIRLFSSSTWASGGSIRPGNNWNLCLTDNGTGQVATFQICNVATNPSQNWNYIIGAQLKSVSGRCLTAQRFANDVITGACVTTGLPTPTTKWLFLNHDFILRDASNFAMQASGTFAGGQPSSVSSLVTSGIQAQGPANTQIFRWTLLPGSAKNELSYSWSSPFAGPGKSCMVATSTPSWGPCSPAQSASLWYFPASRDNHLAYLPDTSNVNQCLQVNVPGQLGSSTSVNPTCATNSAQNFYAQYR